LEEKKSLWNRISNFCERKFGCFSEIKIGKEKLTEMFVPQQAQIQNGEQVSASSS
jgi:hypothetical protein